MKHNQALHDPHQSSITTPSSTGWISRSCHRMICQVYQSWSRYEKKQLKYARSRSRKSCSSNWTKTRCRRARSSVNSLNWRSGWLRKPTKSTGIRRATKAKANATATSSTWKMYSRTTSKSSKYWEVQGRARSWINYRNRRTVCLPRVRGRGSTALESRASASRTE